MPLPPAVLEKIKADLEKGPPPAPSDENPGPFLRSLTHFAREFEKAHGREASTGDLIAHLAYLLDRQAWEQSMVAYNQMKQVYDSHNPPLIARPGFMPPKDIIKPR